MENKKCIKCSKRPASKFSNSYCGKCLNKYNREYYKNINSKNEKYKQTRKNYYLKNIEKAKAVSRKSYLKNKKEIIKRCILRAKRLRKECPLFRLKNLVRSRINEVLAYKGIKKKYKTLKYLGCTWQELKIHLQSQFKSGMNWNNRTEWHVDHIIPLAFFDLNKKEQREFAFSYVNLQPLWAIDNLRKGAR